MTGDPSRPRTTSEHLATFEAALADLEAAPVRESAKLRRLEIEAVQAKADDLRSELLE